VLLGLGKVIIRYQNNVYIVRHRFKNVNTDFKHLTEQKSRCL